jgi:hypothetical protein
MKPKDEKGAGHQWSEPEPDNLKKDFFFSSLLCLGIMAAEFAYAWLVSPVCHNFGPDFWLLMLLPNFISACLVYLTIQALRSWLQKTAAELKAGQTTILAVIGTAIVFLIVAWFFGSAGMRFISE